MKISERLAVRWLLFRTSIRLRACVLLMMVVCVVGYAADRNEAIPAAAPFIITAIAVLGLVVILLAAGWSTPPEKSTAIRNAATIRNGALGLNAAIVVALFMYCLGRGGFMLRELAPGIAISGELTLLAYLGHRAQWYGRHPDLRARLLAEQEEATAARRAAAEARITDRRRKAAAPMVNLVVVEDAEVELPQHLVDPTPPARQPGRDGLDLVDLTGGDDEYPGGDGADEGLEILDRQGNRV